MPLFTVDLSSLLASLPFPAVHFSCLLPSGFYLLNGLLLPLLRVAIHGPLCSLKKSTTFYTIFNYLFILC